MQVSWWWGKKRRGRQWKRESWWSCTTNKQQRSSHVKPASRYKWSCVWRFGGFQGIQHNVHKMAPKYWKVYTFHPKSIKETSWILLLIAWSCPEGTPSSGCPADWILQLWLGKHDRKAGNISRIRLMRNGETAPRHCSVGLEDAQSRRRRTEDRIWKGTLTMQLLTCSYHKMQDHTSIFASGIIMASSVIIT